MLKRFLLALVALLMLPSAASAETLEGSWALRIDGTTVFRFDLSQSEAGNWSGVWTRPRSYRNNGVIFSSLEGRAEITSQNGSVQGDVVRLTFSDPRPRSLPETFRFRLTGAGTAELSYGDSGYAPLPLVRVTPRDDIGPFDEGRLYDRDNAQTAPTRLATPGPAPEAEPELPARAAPGLLPQAQQELPALAAPAPASRPQPVEELPARVTPAPRVSPQPATPASVDPAPALGGPETDLWQPDPSVSAAIAARAAALDRLATPQAAEPEPHAAPQTGAWQPDPSVRATIAARAAALNGAPAQVEEPEAERPEPGSRLGADFLEGL